MQRRGLQIVQRVALSGLLTAGAGWAADKAELPEASGKAATVKLCGTCHGAEIVLGQPHSEEGWADVVANMVQRGASGTDDEFYEVIQYLTKNIKALPKVNVNKASAQQITDGLGLTDKDAGLIVQAREKGELKSLDDLKKIDGLDAKKLVAKKHLISY